MRTDGVVGQKIVRVEQERITYEGATYLGILSTELENGKRLLFNALELEGLHNAITGMVLGPKRKGAPAE